MNDIFNPDVLNCIANLSNDEVFTSPDLANKMLDLLPENLWKDKNVKFLDPFTKSGVFLREIAKRLLEGLKEEIPDLQDRINHIMHNQIYGIAITELTSLLSRRSLYCSKFPNCKYSISKFDDIEGNIRFKRINHTWKDGKCIYCGASKSEYDRGIDFETYAYEWIHNNPKEIYNMKFDVIVGNPPYQLSFGIEGGNSSNAKSIYNLFIQQSIKLNPKYICMITPSRWMTKTAQGISEDWVEEMINCNKFSIIHDFPDASSCFPGVEIKGGVSYFLWDRDYYGKCKYYYHNTHDDSIIERFDYLNSTKADIVIRNPKAYSILEKVAAVEGSYYLIPEKNFSYLVSPKHFFDDSKFLTSNWHGYKSQKDDTYNIKYYLNIDKERTFKWISHSQLPKNMDAKDLHKVYIPAAGGSGNDTQVLGKPFYGEPNSVCSQTFLVIGYDSKKHRLDKQQCLNIISFIKTRFFRYLVSIKKNTQNGPRGVYQFVPILDFDNEWSDEKLYERYNLSLEEIAYIETMVRPMDMIGDESDE